MKTSRMTSKCCSAIGLTNCHSPTHTHKNELFFVQKWIFNIMTITFCRKMFISHLRLKFGSGVLSLKWASLRMVLSFIFVEKNRSLFFVLLLLLLFCVEFHSVYCANWMLMWFFFQAFSNRKLYKVNGRREADIKASHCNNRTVKLEQWKKRNQII